MNNIRISLTIDDLARLTEVSPDHYNVVIKFQNNAGLPLDNPNIPNSYTATVNTISTTFFANVPILDGSYNIPNVTVKVFANDDEDCCLAVGMVNIENTPIDNCDLVVDVQFIQCSGLLAAEITGPAPYIISITTTTDNTERFTSRSGAFLFFNIKSGSHIYVLRVTDAEGCVVTKQVGLACGISNPSFNNEITQPYCDGVNLIPGNVRISDASDVSRYKICYNTLTFNCDDCANSEGIINQGSDTIIYIFPPNQGSSSNVTIRFYNGNGCDNYTDLPFTMTSPTCATGCNMSFTLSNPIC